MITCRAISHGGLGRFGNNCFSIASAIGIAVKNGQPYGFGPWRTMDNGMFGQPVDDIDDYLLQPLPRVVEGVQYVDIPYHWEYRDYNVPTGNWNICSHLQDPRYFEHCMPLIRETFRMKEEKPRRNYIAVHVRCGDYIDDPNAYHPVCSREYYEKAMRYFADQPDFEGFIMFSDDEEKAYKITKGIVDRNMVLSFGNQHYTKDFALMKSCKHFITANSSFSYFAALLGEHPDKKIIMPSRWFGASAGIKFEGYHKEAIII